MRINLLRAAVIATALAGLGACADGYGYGGVGYGGGVGYAGYAGPVGYGADYYGGIGYPAYGVFNDYYYPGSGIYVFDRFGHRRQWNDAERAHWTYRGNGWRGNHLYQGNRFDARRDHAYATDRAAGYRSFRGAGRPGGVGSGPRPGSGNRGADAMRGGGGERRRP